ncbi:MAG: hypothetical protein L0221_02785 [Chloroflexi bacterium]|nr:hypothetical protein [Chloroflexota bacterium]
MSEVEQQASHDEVWARYTEKYAIWLAALKASGLDWASLPRTELQDLRSPPRDSFAEALIASDIAVVGVVESVEFNPSMTSTVVLRVSSVLRGTAAEFISLRQAGGPQPADESWTNAVLVESRTEPLLLPGDGVLLLLEEQQGVQFIQPTSGFFRVEGGVIRPLASNPDAAALEGLEVDSLARLVQAIDN